jgi:hypothetical protein
MQFRIGETDVDASTNICCRQNEAVTAAGIKGECNTAIAQLILSSEPTGIPKQYVFEN